MYRGGIFDHIGGGFSRYSTDDYFLAPHFEKMLYDNALLILAYAKAYELTHNKLYLNVARRTANYVLNEMTSQEKGFYSAQDADSEGIEGKNIPNLLQTNNLTADHHALLQKLYDYRKKRFHLHLDDKILTSWNGLMIAAMCHLYRVTQNTEYINAARQAQSFIDNNLFEENSLFVSWRNICVSLFYDKNASGFFLTGSENEELILQPKETYDGAMPSGNSMMAYNLLRLSHYYENVGYDSLARQQIQFMITEATHYPSGYAMFLCVLLDYVESPTKITIVLKDKTDLEKLKVKAPLSTIVKVLEEATPEYPLVNGQTTYYVCKGRSCQPATNTSPF